MNSKFRIVKSEIGHIKLSDETTISLRIVIIDIREGISMPTGPDTFVKNTVFLSASSPHSLREKVKDKTQPPLDESHIQNIEIWEDQEIVEAKNTFEKCEYTAADDHTYNVIAEAEPTIVSRTLEYKDDYGNPIYHVRWSTKVSTRKK